MRIVRLPAPRSKYLETVVHSLFAAFHALTRRYDLVYVCNSANVPAVIVLLLGRKRVVLNVDGLEWQRAKWNRVGKAYYRACAWLAAHLPAHVVTDAHVIAAHYERAYRRRTEYFPYGTDLDPVPDDGTLGRLGIEPGRYVLYVSRLEPENNAHVVVEAFGGCGRTSRWSIVGDAPYASDYIAYLKRRPIPACGSRAPSTGPATTCSGRTPRCTSRRPRSGERTRRSSRRWGSGTRSWPTTSRSIGRPWARRDATTSGAEELSAQLQALLDKPALANRLRRRAHERASSVYSWEGIVDAYEAWFRGLVG